MRAVVIHQFCWHRLMRLGRAGWARGEGPGGEISRTSDGTHSEYIDMSREAIIFKPARPMPLAAAPDADEQAAHGGGRIILQP